MGTETQVQLEFAHCEGLNSIFLFRDEPELVLGMSSRGVVSQSCG